VPSLDSGPVLSREKVGYSFLLDVTTRGINHPHAPAFGFRGCPRLAVALSITGCGRQVTPPVAVPNGLPAEDRSILAGDWEYEDGGTVVLQLDAQGNGTYAYKDGRFETHDFGGG
jgi:hypothetical protein